MSAAWVAAATAAVAMQVASPDFRAGGTIPLAFMSTDCGGRNLTPALAWKNAPKNTKSFALIVRDPDAPVAGGFVHWVIYDMPAPAHALAAGASLPGVRLGLASTGKAAYYGPCPPPGPAHHYIFTLYALDVASVGSDVPPFTAARLEGVLRGHAIARATLEAIAARRR
jgi:Raf kinase inhibitor-like YbhB/YbcL family protein